ncbi:T6SS phospholipase effector Tle1-like catalytic domain-containing protein [Pseudomonas putida]|uniref:T6SS phospholipase effector Tle1-like catalytic domain-containing protein n=1 Tax=Pseudomonas putida TaxID=303 RepID=UPI0005BB01AF|nr:DUF2235 domain-containing protein [Pseudomonas putida]
MSKVNKSPVWLPPEFPLQGRLPQQAHEVYQNLGRQCSMERDYHDALCVASGRRVMLPCCQTLHISLFFDGTGNNLSNDLYESAVPHPTNIARLFRASIGDGHAGGTMHSGKARWLTDAAGTGGNQYFKYYMPGVGTPFPEVGDLDYTSDGLAFARRGEERINWGLLMVIDALRRILGLPRLDDATLKAAVEAMGTWRGTEWIMGRANRGSVFRRELKALEEPLRRALSALPPGQPTLVGMKLYVYGFSRGAAAARAFVNWFNQLLAPKEPSPTLQISSLKLPVSIEYLGLLDTVVSVGLADIAPGANGHMGWGDGSQELPKGPLVKRCLHIVASHEQRLSFPLESIRREDGTYPENSVEVIYPGVHSDQGGGYPPGDQGKAWSSNNVQGDGLLLSQIALHDLYSDAYENGAPLKTPLDVLPADLREEAWRAMGRVATDEFDVSSLLISRFNAWRQVTLQLARALEPLPSAEIVCYRPHVASADLESALRSQMDWLTAWRIDRYAFGSLESTGFYRVATDEHATPEARTKAEAERDHKQSQVVKRRALQLHLERRGAPAMPLEPGIKDFDPDKSKTQLRDAADEFRKIYRDLDSDPYLTFFRRARWVNVPAFITYWNSADKIAEHERMKACGQAKVSQLFPPPRGQKNHTSETHRGNVDENRNREQPEGLLRALFDDHVHDSRAWFLHALLNSKYKGTAVAAGREPWGSYFTERMVFFGEANRRDVAFILTPDGATDSGTSVALAEVDPAQSRILEAQRRAQFRQKIQSVWDDYYATLEGGRDGQA